MSEFSVSYAGLEDAYSQLGAITQRLGGISSDLHQTASKVGGIKSLANKGYRDKIVACARNANTTAEKVSRQAYNLSEIGRLYSRTEKKVLSTLSEVVSPENGFSADSDQLAKSALEGHQAINFAPSVGEAIVESIADPAHNTLNFIDEFHYWRSTYGKKWIDEHSIKSPILDEFIDGANKMIGQYEDLAHAIINPTNPEALKKGAEAVAGIFGFGEVVKLYNRYHNIQNAVETRAQRELDAGHKGKYVAQMLVGSTLTFGQMAVDSVVTGGKMALDSATGGMFSKVSKPVQDALHKTFAGWGDALRKKADSI